MSAETIPASERPHYRFVIITSDGYERGRHDKEGER